MKKLLVGLCLLGSTQVMAEGSELLSIQQEWARVNYTLKDDAQIDAYKALIAQTESFKAANPQNADSWIWYGIVQSSFAGAKGGLGALKYAENAKESFEQALKLNANALDGSAYTSLGTLYHKVPGWPIGFGDDDKAGELFKKALVINPNGLDINYFYGEYLYDERKYKEAKKYLELAKLAPAREGRPLADKSRQEEVDALLAKVNKKLKKKH